MSKKITISNFLAMHPEVPEFSAKNQNYLIAGANPLYYLDNNTQEEQLAPLAASIDWLNTTFTFDGNIIQIIQALGNLDAASNGNPFEVYIVTDHGHVYGISRNVSTNVLYQKDLGYPYGTGYPDTTYPTGSAVSDGGCTIAIGGKYLFFTLSLQQQGNYIYKMLLTDTTWTWTALTGSLNTLTYGVGAHLMCPFTEGVVAIKDGSTSGLPGSLVRTINVATFVINSPPTQAIDLGIGWGVMKICNLNGQYLVIAAGQNNSNLSGSGYVNNYLYIWDGISNTYNFATPIPGKFLDMRVINSILEVAVQVSSGKTYLFYLNNKTLKQQMEMAYSTITPYIYSFVPNVIFDYKNLVGLVLSTTSDFTFPLMINSLKCWLGWHKMEITNWITPYRKECVHCKMQWIHVGYNIWMESK